MKYASDPQVVVVYQIIEGYFENILHYCTTPLTLEDSEAVTSIATQVAASMVDSITLVFPLEDQIRLYHSILLRFMNVLLTYDKDWVWETLGAFSEMLPEQMLN